LRGVGFLPKQGLPSPCLSVPPPTPLCVNVTSKIALRKALQEGINGVEAPPVTPLLHKLKECENTQKLEKQKLKEQNEEQCHITLTDLQVGELEAVAKRFPLCSRKEVLSIIVYLGLQKIRRLNVEQVLRGVSC